ncbi:MAG: helix-turn-helix domain-containing protein [Oligoflexia bacterium]|nr:helix-turn-helix domain-containing protein [Oligoflexia bacterium]
MNIRSIRNDDDLTHALDRVDTLWNAEPGTPEGDELDVLAVLIEAYEAEHYALPPGDPLEVIHFKLAELKLSQRALAGRMGWKSTGRLSEVLSGKRELTMRMVRDLAAALEIPAGLLVGDPADKAPPAARSLDLPSGLVAQVESHCGKLGQSPAAWLRQVLDRQAATSA